MSKSPQVFNDTLPFHSMGQQLLFVKSTFYVGTSTDVVLRESPRSSQGLGWIQPGARHFQSSELRLAPSALVVADSSSPCCSSRKDPQERALCGWSKEWIRNVAFVSCCEKHIFLHDEENSVYGKILLFNELPLSFSFEVANEAEVNILHLLSKVNSSSWQFKIASGKTQICERS